MPLTETQFSFCAQKISAIEDKELSLLCTEQLNRYAGSSDADKANRLSFDELCHELQNIIEDAKVSIVKAPTCGRIVHFYHNGNDAICGANGAEFVPAIVVQNWGTLIANLSVFPMNPEATNVLRYSVHHKSEAIVVSENGETNIIYPTYWDYPVIK